jgi:Na+/melibiose symporter-like transporter
VARALRLILIGKGARVLVSAVLSVMMPVYLASVGYSPFMIGVVLAAILGGNAFSNILLIKFGHKLGLKRFLLAFSLLMFAAGVSLFLTSEAAVVVLASFIGNVSTTGTEAGPFQSVEAGVLPNLVSANRLSRTFGIYNLVGYSASSVGAFVSSAPAYASNELFAFRVLFLAFGSAGLLLFGLYMGVGELEPRTAPSDHPAGQGGAAGDVKRISALFSLDAFGGSFVSQFVLSFWFNQVYGVPLAALGIIFFVTSVISAASIFGASLLAERLGNLRTMFYTHVVSNVFLLLIPLAGSLTFSLAFLFLRQSLSQMDVPTRQAFMADVFSSGGLVSANAVTNTMRSIGSVLGGPFSTAMFAIGALSLPIITGSVSKLVYDVGIFSSYRKRAK